MRRHLCNVVSSVCPKADVVPSPWGSMTSPPPGDAARRPAQHRRRSQGCKERLDCVHWQWPIPSVGPASANSARSAEVNIYNEGHHVIHAVRGRRCAAADSRKATGASRSCAHQHMCISSALCIRHACCQPQKIVDGLPAQPLCCRRTACTHQCGCQFRTGLRSRDTEVFRVVTHSSCVSRSYQHPGPTAKCGVPPMC